VNVALVAVTLMINSVALSAILFRLVSFGFTPNRVVVLGANITILIHLVHIFRSYLTSVRRRDGFPTIDAVIGKYLPVYSAWAAIVLFVLPLVFGFK
jgi:tetrahydromethanopterin S-methyltransferase subunit E